MIVIREYSDEIKAGLTVDFLKKNDINCFLSKDDPNGMQPLLGFMSGFRILVDPSQAEEAENLILSLESEKS